MPTFQANVYDNNLWGLGSAVGGWNGDTFTYNAATDIPEVLTWTDDDSVLADTLNTNPGQPVPGQSYDSNEIVQSFSGSSFADGKDLASFLSHTITGSDGSVFKVYAIALHNGGSGVYDYDALDGVGTFNQEYYMIFEQPLVDGVTYTLSDYSINGNMDVSQFEVTPGVVCPLYDFIELSGVPGVGDNYTTAAGELVEIDEPLNFNSADGTTVQNGDTVDIGGVTWTVTGLSIFEADVTYAGGTDVMQGILFELSDGAGGTLTYAAPLDGAGVINPYPDISAMDFTSITGINQVAKDRLDVDNNVTLICFAKGTMVETASGPVAIETIAEGDLVRTVHSGMQPVRWIGSTTVAAREGFAPVLIREGALGNTADLRVSQQHRIVMRSSMAELFFEENEVLVPAKHLVNGETVTIEEGGEVTYFHMLFDTHEIIYSEGLETESFHPGQMGVSSLDKAAQDEIFALFPELKLNIANYGPSRFATLKAHESSVLTAA